MHLNHNEITLLYRASDPRDKRVVPYAMSLCSKINKQDLETMNISATLFDVMVEMLGCSPKELINKADPEYQSKHRGHEYTPEMWFAAMKKNPNLLKAPIAMYKKKIVVCHNPSDVLRLK
ncbi:MAG: hypothetical protein JJU02_00515 [Cryomorphaceae bacterium]|nr:hypothetical protein [Cryomorphaceae bacterium]